jgi:hypothetical protein
VRVNVAEISLLPRVRGAPEPQCQHDLSLHEFFRGNNSAMKQTRLCSGKILVRQSYPAVQTTVYMMGNAVHTKIKAAVL